MQATVTVSDTMSPDLRRLYRAASDKAGIHQAIGLGLVSLGARAFGDASIRPAPWAPKKDGTLSTLRKSGTLWQSVRVTGSGATGVTVGSDRAYAAIHQLGGRTAASVIRPKNKKALYWPGARHPVKSVNHPGSNIPARPYLPFTAAGDLTPAAERMIEGVVRAKLRVKG